ncbi:MAG: hypothetical protein M1118_14750 [Chloroflexi bacterium]|nr:hypothetical protein [Chloroflexota bacterium]
MSGAIEPLVTTVILTEQESAIILHELRDLREVATDDRESERVAWLVGQVNEGRVSGEALDGLGALLELELQSGAIRQRHGSAGEMALRSVYLRTPRGKALVEAAQATSTALSALRSQCLDDVRITALGPGQFSLFVDTDRCQITVRFEGSLVRVESVALGL